MSWAPVSLGNGIVYFRVLPVKSYAVNEFIELAVSIAINSPNTSQYDIVTIKFKIAGKEFKDTIVLEPTIANPKATDATIVLPSPHQLGIGEGEYTVECTAEYGGDTRTTSTKIKVVDGYYWPYISHVSVNEKNVKAEDGKATLTVSVKFNALIPPIMGGEPVYVELRGCNETYRYTYKIGKSDIWRETLVFKATFDGISRTCDYKVYAGAKSPYEDWRVVWKEDGIVHVEVVGAVPPPKPQFKSAKAYFMVGGGTSYRIRAKPGQEIYLAWEVELDRTLDRERKIRVEVYVNGSKVKEVVVPAKAGRSKYYSLVPLKFDKAGTYRVKLYFDWA